MDIAAGAVFEVLIIVIIGLIGWIVRNLNQDTKSNRTQLAEFKTHVAEEYQTKTDQRELKEDIHRELSELKGMVKALFDKFDRLMGTERGNK